MKNGAFIEDLPLKHGDFLVFQSANCSTTSSGSLFGKEICDSRAISVRIKEMISPNFKCQLSQLGSLPLPNFTVTSPAKNIVLILHKVFN